MYSYVSQHIEFSECFSSCQINTGSCGGRCGEGYYRGSFCQCDYDCLGLNECCTDFQDLCTSSTGHRSTGLIYILCKRLLSHLINTLCFSSQRTHVKDAVGSLLIEAIHVTVISTVSRIISAVLIMRACA